MLQSFLNSLRRITRRPSITGNTSVMQTQIRNPEAGSPEALNQIVLKDAFREAADCPLNLKNDPTFINDWGNRLVKNLEVLEHLQPKSEIEVPFDSGTSKPTLENQSSSPQLGLIDQKKVATDLTTDLAKKAMDRPVADSLKGAADISKMPDLSDWGSGGGF